MGIQSTSSSSSSQAQTVNVYLPTGKNARNIKRVYTDTGYPVSWQIINDNQIQVSVNGGAGSTSSQTTTTTTYSCASTNPYNDGTYSGTLSLTGGQGTPTCSYGGNLSANQTAQTTVPKGEVCSSTYNGMNLVSQTSKDANNDYCNYSGTTSKYCTNTAAASSSTSSSTTYTTTYGYTVTVDYDENNSRSYHVNRVGRNGRGVIR